MAVNKSNESRVAALSGGAQTKTGGENVIVAKQLMNGTAELFF